VNGTPLLEVDSLRVRYGRATGVEKVSLTINDGEAVALVGPNGAGKTTTLRAIGGFLPREGVRRGGAVRFAGERIDARRPWHIARLGLATIPAVTKVFGHMTVREHLRMAGPATRGETSLDEALTLFPELARQLDTSAASLSGGQRQMLALTAATLMRPRLLLIDELSQGLSPAAVGTIAATLRTLSERGMAMLIVEQSLAVALSIASRCYALDAGLVVADGPAEEFASSEGVQASYLGVRHPARPGAGPRPSPEPAASEPAASELTAAEPTAMRPGAGDPEAATAPALAIRVEHVSISFRGIAALSDVSLDVGSGECLGMVGPNGAGKSTLLNCINLAVQPDEGQIWIAGRPVRRMRPHQLAALGVARTFQSAELWRGLTVGEVVALGAHSRRLADRKARDVARQSLDLVGLNVRLDARVGDLPYGHAKLVDLARALAADPSVLLLDEPASGLSAQERVTMTRILLKIGGDMNLTQVIVEHDMQLVQDCCSRIAVLSHGQVIADGPPGQVLADPRVAEELLGMSAGAGTGTGTGTDDVRDEAPA
jgi:ABC-type branched-subunit amino acid transport system ATPase component